MLVLNVQGRDVMWFFVFGGLQGREVVYTTTVETLLLFLVWGFEAPYGVYPSFRTYGVYAFGACFRKRTQMVYTIAVFAHVTLGSGNRPPERSGATVVVYTLFPLSFLTKAKEKTEENGSDTVRATLFAKSRSHDLLVPFHSPVGPEGAFHCSDSLVCLPQRLHCVVARLWLLFACAKWQVLWANAKAEKRNLLAADPSICPRAHEAKC